MARKNQIYEETIYAWNISTNLPQTGDAGNITLYTVKDGAISPGAATTNSVVEIDSVKMPGFYWINLTASEMNGDSILVSGTSITANVQIQGSSISTEDIKTDTLQLITDVGNVQTDTAQLITDVGNVQTDTTQILSDISVIDGIVDQILLDTTAINIDTAAIVAKLPASTISDFNLDDVVDGAKVRTILGLIKARVINKYNWNETTGQLDFFQNDNVTAFASVTISDVGRTKLSFVDL